MGSFPTRQQWLIVILVNILISAITTILVVRVMTRPADAVDAPTRAVAAAAATQPAPEATPRAQSVAASPAPANPAPAATPIPPTVTRPAPTPTAVPVVAPEKVAVVISNINFPGQRQRESVVIANEGDTLELKGWTLSSPRGVVYTFGNVSLFRDNFINIYTTTGADIATDLFMNRADAAWQVGDIVTLARDGRAQATYTIKP
jgi:cytoskeletal protein RodZ